MRLINADELMEHVWRDKLDSRELIANLIEQQPTVIDFKEVIKDLRELAKEKKELEAQNKTLNEIVKTFRGEDNLIGCTDCAFEEKEDWEMPCTDCKRSARDYWRPIGKEPMKVTLDEGAYMPERAHETDAGYDLRTPIRFVLPPGGSTTIDTGVHIQLPKGKCAIIISKSGLNVNKDITNTGLVDEDYTGSIRVKLYNNGFGSWEFEKGDKISQFVIMDYYAYDLELVDRLDDTERGDSGFGSTGR